MYACACVQGWADAWTAGFVVFRMVTRVEASKALRAQSHAACCGRERALRFGGTHLLAHRNPTWLQRQLDIAQEWERAHCWDPSLLHMHIPPRLHIASGVRGLPGSLALICP